MVAFRILNNIEELLLVSSHLFFSEVIQHSIVLTIVHLLVCLLQFHLPNIIVSESIEMCHPTVPVDQFVVLWIYSFIKFS